MFEPLTQRLKRLSDDERAVSPVVGFVLIFALIMLVFAIYQADVVPAQNEEVEFKHSQEVEGDMSQLSSAMVSAGSTGTVRAQTVATGMNYPSRTLFINPGPPTGSLRLGDESDERTVDLSKVSANGSKYWDTDSTDDGGGETTFESKPVIYSVNYNLLQNDPRFTIRDGQLFRQYGGSEALSNGGASGGDPIPDNEIDLLLVDGNLSQNGQTASVEINPVSTSTEYLTGTAYGNTILTFSTTLNKSEAEDMIGNGFSSSGKEYAAFRGYTSHSSRPNTVDVKLKPNTTFEFSITKISLGSEGEATAHEVIPTEEPTGPDNATARLDATVGEEKSFTVLVRDEYGNSVSGADVNEKPGSNVDSGNVTGQSPTNDQGKAKFTYTPNSTGSKEITVISPDTSFNATYEFNVSSSSSEDSSSDTDNSSEGGDRIVYAEGDSLMSFSTKTGSVKDHSPQSVDVVGSATTLLDGSHSIPFYGDSSEANSALQYIDDSGDITELPTGSTTVKSQKSVVATANWNGNPTSVYYATNNDEDIYRIDPNKSSPDKVASPGDGVNGVLGTGDIDSDETEELVYVDGSQAIRYLDPDPGDSSEEELGGAGSNNNVGAGEPASFWGYGVQVPIIDGSNNVALMAGDGSKTTLTNNSPAEKTLVTPTDVDGDGRLEVVFVHTDGYLAYVDDISGDQTVKAVTDDNGDRITGVDTGQGVK